MRFLTSFSDMGKKEGKDSAVVDWMQAAAEGKAAMVAIDDAGGDP